MISCIDKIKHPNNFMIYCFDKRNKQIKLTLTDRPYTLPANIELIVTKMLNTFTANMRLTVTKMLHTITASM